MHRATGLKNKGSKCMSKQGHEFKNDGSRIHFVDKITGVHKIVTFDPECFLGWMALLCYRGTVFELGTVKSVLLGTAMLGGVTALISARVDSISSEDFTTEPLNKLANFIMVFLVFMTGLFVNGAFTRWQQILQNLFTVIESLKALYMDLVMQSAPADSIQDIKRWGFASVFLVAREAPAVWDGADWDAEFKTLEGYDLMNEAEATKLFSKEGSKAALPWGWIVMKIRELSEQGLAPPRQTPALVRMLDHVHAATNALSNVENLTLMQVPYQYMHMLGFLVHFFIIINAVRCGIDLGKELGEARKEARNSGYYMPLPDVMLGQMIIVNLLFMMLGPLIYQAFIAITADMMLPFGKGSTDIPVRFLVENFNKEMNDMDDFVKKPMRGTSLEGVRQAG